MKFKPEIKYMNVEDLKPYENNPRDNKEAVKFVANSIEDFDFINPIIINKDGVIIAGHTRLEAAKKNKINEVPVIVADHLTEEQEKAFRIADNSTAEVATWNLELRKIEIESMPDLDFSDYGLDLSFNLGDNEDSNEHIQEDYEEEYEEESSSQKGSLSKNFIIPPFSILNAREGMWQKRKSAWLNMGIESEVGRDENLLKFSETCNKTQPGTSIFDPVLCELMYLWFSPEEAKILDPFAGGSVRGVTASILGRKYTGIDLRDEQILENKKQALKICKENQPQYICDDSKNLLDHNIEPVDFIFSCPPYADLEVYSDNPQDLSTMAYDDFITAYSDIIKKACSLLKDDCFACFVVGEVRNKKGFYYNFVGDTIKSFIDSGLSYYNEMILVTAIGSLPIRAGKIFNASRKIGKTHQNILVFCKGDPKKASAKIKEIDKEYLDFILSLDSFNA